MKLDQADLKDMFEENDTINKEQKILDLRRQALKDKKKLYIIQYFEDHGMDEIKALPTSHNTFISHPEFFLKKSETGKIFWVAIGTRISVKDGKSTYGNVKDEFWQGQWEALPENLKKLTLEEAKKKSETIFPMVKASNKGCDFSSPGYLLHEDKSGWQLIWRKSGTAYINRFAGSLSANSGLQIIFKANDKAHPTEQERKHMQDLYNKATNSDIDLYNFYLNLCEGGRLGIGVIDRNTELIDGIFGDGVAQSIVDKLKLESANKAKIRKELKSEGEKETSEGTVPEPVQKPKPFRI